MSTLRRIATTALLAVCTLTASAWTPEGQQTALAAQQDSVKTTQKAKEKKSFGQKLLAPFKWIGENWSAYDPAYSIPSFYDWAAQIQNTASREWLNLGYGDTYVQMRSKMSNKVGPYFGWSFIFYGFTVDLNTIGSKEKKKRKNEFTLAINSNLVNLDIIRRRTGGDFSIRKMNLNMLGEKTDLMDGEQMDFGEFIYNDLTGFNLNVFTNHKKYSNPAAFSNGAIQLKSAGSPIIGLGYTHQKVESAVSHILNLGGTMFMMDDNLDPIIPEEEVDAMGDLEEDQLKEKVKEYLGKGWQYFGDGNPFNIIARSLITNPFPALTTVDDYHLQLGYAYNLAFSRRLLLGLSAVASPGIKRVHITNKGGIAYEFADDFARWTRQYENRDSDPSEFAYDKKINAFNVNVYGRASLTFNFNRWRAGVIATASTYYFKKDGAQIRNTFGDACIYVGYCFGRKKEYRYNGEKRQDYIMAALTKRQIEEMDDTMPASNIDKGATYAAANGKTRFYHTDVFDINIFGCDLVKGPEGKYGWYEVQDGFITEGQDTEGRISKGKVVEVNADGEFELEAGHHRSFRAGNWWKSQLNIGQTPSQWFPEMLHYALKGKLTLYVRGRIFGTKKPVKLELEDFCINHGKETQNFRQMGIQSFNSNSMNSIEGKATVNGKECRIYIRQKKNGKNTDMYISRVYPSNSYWMKDINDQRPVSTISIPGTHDSGTASLNDSPVLNAGLTQNFSMIAQLKDGIRAFDIRLKKNMNYGHTFACKENFDSTMVEWNRFLEDNPSECIIAMVGSDEGGKWSDEMKENFQQIIDKYPHRFTQDFNARTSMSDARGKILVIKRQEACPFGKLLKFTDNAIFDYDCFHVEDVYKEHKTWKKIKLVEKNIRDAYENEDPDKWFITFNSIAWSPRRHNPYSYAWGDAKNIRYPMNRSLSDIIELKDYTDFGIVYLDFYNNRGEKPQVVETIIRSNFHLDLED